MKKFAAIFFALALFAMLPLSALAATGINEYEQAVLDKLTGCQIADSTGKVISVPEEYLNAARNYFLGDYDMTKEEMDVIMEKINACIVVVEEDVSNSEAEGEHLSLSDINTAARDEVLNLGQEAANEVNLNVSYNATAQQITVTSSQTNSTVFVSSKPIKTTGEDFPITTGFMIASVAAVLALGTAVIFGVSKKAGLLVK